MRWMGVDSADRCASLPTDAPGHDGIDDPHQDEKCLLSQHRQREPQYIAPKLKFYEAWQFFKGIPHHEGSYQHLP